MSKNSTMNAKNDTKNEEEKKVLIFSLYWLNLYCAVSLLASISMKMISAIAECVFGGLYHTILRI